MSVGAVFGRATSSAIFQSPMILEVAMASRRQLDFLIDKYRENPDDGLMNKIHEVVDALVGEGQLSPKEASAILASI